MIDYSARAVDDIKHCFWSRLLRPVSLLLNEHACQTDVLVSTRSVIDVCFPPSRLMLSIHLGDDNFQVSFMISLGGMRVKHEYQYHQGCSHLFNARI